jgi:hypothetical protein
MIKNIKDSIKHIVILMEDAWLIYAGRLEEIPPDKVDINE